MTHNGAIVDLDGTIYRGDTAISGSRDGIERLRERGLEILFCSNNSTRSPEAYVEHLREFGIETTVDAICSAGTATVEYLREHHPTDRVFLVGSRGFRDQLQGAGVELTDSPAETDVLVASWTDDFDYGDMTDALHAVDEETTFLGTNRDRTLPQADGGVLPGSGSIIFALAATVGRDPDALLGKPSEWMAEAVLDRLELPAEECLLIGDRLDTDLAMGARTGMTTVLVLSGISDRDDIDKGDVEPDYVIENLGAIGDVLSEYSR